MRPTPMVASAPPTRRKGWKSCNFPIAADPIPVARAVGRQLEIYLFSYISSRRGR